MSFSKDEIELWIARGKGEIPSPVDPGASANSARAMLEFNKTYGDIQGAFVDKDKRFLLGNIGQFITEKQLTQLKRSKEVELDELEQELKKDIESFEKECEEITYSTNQSLKVDIIKLENKIIRIQAISIGVIIYLIGVIIAFSLIVF